MMGTGRQSSPGWGDLGDFRMSEKGANSFAKAQPWTTASEFKIRSITPGTTPRTTARRRAVRSGINKAVDIITSGVLQNMKVQLDGTYDIYFDLANSQIYIMSEGKTLAEVE